MKFKALIQYSAVLVGRWGREKKEKEDAVGPHSALGAGVKVSVNSHGLEHVQVWDFLLQLSGFFSKSLHFVHFSFWSGKSS